MGLTFHNIEEAISRGKVHAEKESAPICVYIKGLFPSQIGDHIGYGLTKGLRKGAYWLCFPDGSDRLATKKENKEGQKNSAKLRAKIARQAKKEAMLSIGLVRGKDSLGREIWE